MTFTVDSSTVLIWFTLGWSRTTFVSYGGQNKSLGFQLNYKDVVVCGGYMDTNKVLQTMEELAEMINKSQIKSKIT